MKGGVIKHNFERRLDKGHSSQFFLNSVQWIQRRRFKCDLLSKYA